MNCEINIEEGIMTKIQPASSWRMQVNSCFNFEGAGLY